MKYNIYHWSIPINFVVLHYLWSGLWQCCGIDLRPKIVWKSYIRLYSKTFSSNLILQVWNTMFSTWVQSTSLPCIHLWSRLWRNAVESTFVLRLCGSLIFFFIASKTFSSNLILQVWNTMFSTWIFQTTSLSCITYEVVYDNAVGSTFVPRLLSYIRLYSK